MAINYELKRDSFINCIASTLVLLFVQSLLYLWCCCCFFCRENYVQRNVHFLRFHIVWVHISRHKEKKIIIQCMNYCVIEKIFFFKKEEKRKINNRFLGTKDFLAFFFCILLMSASHFFFMFVQSSVRRKMKTCWRRLEREKQNTNTQCIVSIPSASFYMISFVVVQVIFAVAAT